ncbi:hypothetical protein MHH57_21430 [Paenibacillus sp. FSL H7-0442]
MEKIDFLETMDFDMEVQQKCDPDNCRADCIESPGNCSSNTTQWY